jgi:hypothetical protein
MEAAEQAKKEREAAAAAEQVTTNAVSYTPDYAAGLVSPAPSVSIYTFMLYTGNSHKVTDIDGNKQACKICGNAC